MSCLMVAIALLALACTAPVAAASGDPVTVLYQNSFSNDPKWVTNNPSSDYWDPGREMYHFKIEPSTGAYAYTLVKNYDRQSFTFEYDVIITSIDEEAAFRLGFSGADMDINKGPNVLTEFTNAKYGQIMWLHLVTPSNKMVQVNSESGDTQSSGEIAYKGPTVKYSLNKTYHVTVNYVKSSRVLSMKVYDKQSGDEVWGYYVNTGEDLSGMNRIYLGSIGVYGRMNIYAEGYIDNVRITVPDTSATVSTPLPTASSTPAAVASQPTSRPTVKVTTALPTSAVPAATQESPLSGTTAAAALGIAALCCGLCIRKRE